MTERAAPEASSKKRPGKTDGDASKDAKAAPSDPDATSETAVEEPADETSEDEGEAEAGPPSVRADASDEEDGSDDADDSDDNGGTEEETSEPPPSVGRIAPSEAEDVPDVGDEEDEVDIRFRVFGRTDVGQIREHNEDNFLVAMLDEDEDDIETNEPKKLGPRGAVFAVCDGMGGAAAGEVASQLAVDIVHQRMAAGDTPVDHDELALRLVRSIEAAGLRIFSEAKLDRTRRGMGTTATVAALIDEFLFLGQVGDSRAYLLRDDRLVQVTRDQSLVNQLIEAGQLTEEEAETFEHNNIILQALGTADTVQVDLTFVELRRGDTLMLCSDGLSGMIRNEEIREVLLSIDDPTQACRELTDRANQAGGHDNVTVVVVKFDGESLDATTTEDVDALSYQKYELPEAPPNSLPAIEPSGRVKEFDQVKVSARFSSRPPGPDIEVGEDEEGWDNYDDGLGHRRDDPIDIPTDRAPSWLVTMMIVSALTCVVLAGYYLLR